MAESRDERRRSSPDEAPKPAAPVNNADVAARAEGKRSIIEPFHANVLFPDWRDRTPAKSGADTQNANRPELDGRLNDVALPVNGFGATPRAGFSAEAFGDATIDGADRLQLSGFALLPALALLFGLMHG